MVKMKNILLIDDDEVANFINERQVKASGIAKQIHVAQSGVAALSLLKEKLIGTKERPDIIFLDIRMPVMDGFEFLEEFNKLPEDHIKDIKVVMLSSSLAETDRQKAGQYKNVVGFINKPLNSIKIEELKSKLI
jgi:CheY-like chemotaxis protein